MSSCKSKGDFFLQKKKKMCGSLLLFHFHLISGAFMRETALLIDTEWQVMPLDVTEPGSNRVTREVLGKHPQRVL